MLNRILSLITRRQFSVTRLEKTVSFCDSCGDICTPECHANALLRHHEMLNLTTLPKL
jgi:hypothetical protein